MSSYYKFKKALKSEFVVHVSNKCINKPQTMRFTNYYYFIFFCKICLKLITYGFYYYFTNPIIKYEIPCFLVTTIIEF